MRTLLALALFFLGPLSAMAGERTVKLSVPGMYCSACPYIVQETIADVDGVRAVEATIDDKSATVTFDDAVTSIEAILGATAGIGYPATVAEPQG